MEIYPTINAPPRNYPECKSPEFNVPPHIYTQDHFIGASTIRKKKKGCFSLPSTSISLTTTLSKRKKWVRLYQVRNAMSQSPSRLFLAALLDASRSELHEVRNSYTSLFSCPKLLLLLNACSLGNP